MKASGKFCPSNPVFTNPDNYTGRRKRGRERGSGEEKDGKKKKRERGSGEERDGERKSVKGKEKRKRREQC